MLRIGVPDLSELSDSSDLSDKGIQSTRQGATQLAPQSEGRPSPSPERLGGRGAIPPYLTTPCGSDNRV
ncbi:hypothetical protein [Porphyromonas somerae]|uniref:hypothetical protein n=1 Tax=Porphyromonas somerae TaxID=322095 RepID=UPI002A7F08F3|nr:hypothetical protein [Porphyromonas somerae]MDY3883898.1 hypothetical protein [Porphyromonas somerae]